ncbi:MAG: threonine/serine dehydratase [Anaerolineales bacterium]
MFSYPTLPEIKATAERLAPHVLRTPVWRWQTGLMETASPAREVWLKLELFQKTGTFKARGALNNVLALDEPQRARGVTAVSAGNHAIAVAYAARARGTTAKVVMMEYASPARVALCRELGAMVELLPTVHAAFERVKQIEAEEGRTFIHPFDLPRTISGTATLGLEFHAQVPDLDTVLVPVGGGGLIAGVAAALKQLNPKVIVIGVEPFGADSMYRSFQSGQPEKIEKVETIADSLGAPYALPYSFGVARRFVDEIVRVTDDELCAALFYLFRDMKLVAEPAAAATTAALLGPLRDRVAGQCVGLIVCGTNIDEGRFTQYLQRGVEVVRQR